MKGEYLLATAHKQRFFNLVAPCLITCEQSALGRVATVLV